jgi:hypothetical protein
MLATNGYSSAVATAHLTSHQIQQMQQWNAATSGSGGAGKMNDQDVKAYMELKQAMWLRNQR